MIGTSQKLTIQAGWPYEQGWLYFNPSECGPRNSPIGTQSVLSFRDGYKLWRVKFSYFHCYLAWCSGGVGAAWWYILLARRIEVKKGKAGFNLSQNFWNQSNRLLWVQLCWEGIFFQCRAVLFVIWTMNQLFQNSMMEQQYQVEHLDIYPTTFFAFSHLFCSCEF